MAKREREGAGGGEFWQRDSGKRACTEASFALSSLLSSLPPLMAKRGRDGGDRPPDAAKRRRRGEDDCLEARMRGLMICQKMISQEEEVSAKERPWSSLLTEMLELILSRLPLSDVPRFGAVCKHWSSCIFPVYPANASPLLMNSTLTDTGFIRCYSPYFNKIFVFNTPLKVPNSKIGSATDGWFTLKRQNKIVLANPVNGTLHKFPDFESGPEYFCTSWVQPHNCKIFGVYSYGGTTRVETWDAKSWTRIEYEGDQPRFSMSCCNPVLHKGLLYCLGDEGSLGVYDAVGINWTVLEKPSSFGFSYKYSYLVESEGELLAVLTEKNGTPIYVLRLNEMEMEWEKMETLGGRALFTGTVASFSVTKPPESMANKIYLPRFYGEPETIQAELRNSDGRLFFVPKGHRSYEMNGVNRRKDYSGAWCYDLESGMDQDFIGSKNLLQHIWVNLSSGS